MAALDSIYEHLFTHQVSPAEKAARIEIELHYDCKDGDPGAWLCRVFDADGKHISADTGDTASQAFNCAMRPHEVLLDGAAANVAAPVSQSVIDMGATSPPKLIVQVMDATAGPGGKGLMLCTADGQALPRQVGMRLEQRANDITTLDVTFDVDGDDVTLGPNVQV